MQGYSEFGKQVKITMISLGISSRELAQLLGYKESTLCDMLKGRNRNRKRQAEIGAILSHLQIQNVERGWQETINKGE